jgi:hypothetical protein
LDASRGTDLLDDIAASDQGPPGRQRLSPGLLIPDPDSANQYNGHKYQADQEFLHDATSGAPGDPSGVRFSVWTIDPWPVPWQVSNAEEATLGRHPCPYSIVTRIDRPARATGLDYQINQLVPKAFTASPAASGFQAGVASPFEKAVEEERREGW